MEQSDESLYGASEADFFRKRAESWDKRDLQKFDLMLKYCEDSTRLVDVGCGWGKFLEIASKQVDEVWGVDESIEMTKGIEQNCPRAQVVICRADNLDLPSGYFDIAVTSQMLHEVKLFGTRDELYRSLSEIRRILVSGGKYLLVDHLDAGDGNVDVFLPSEKVKLLQEFESKFKYYRAKHNVMAGDIIRISKRTLQDFLSKDIFLNSPMESLEMNETHNVFTRGEVEDCLAAVGMRIEDWIEFMDVTDDLINKDGRFISGKPWMRKFLCVAARED
ncbi:MAG: methyltransferase domain-containing protein [candidate division Zixibacteria bacterium]|nr:methyltransferase domain-containing protein [candidate division Zixibacteria bacterium]NIR68077.1 methyltransferase domain-containing protein [candidate division Zixibacteria bacterium]NIS16861.1 methyltransferase domain-containing protein [candidate division Zixibacteria bacterium]NIS49296.1 methyltransferase domain-containing protein [candidate division Zixibacteria bacterium]NIT53263.1 methyltransferase domain-containing protein [candidate division Zixibacteria bacterium]